MLGGRPAEGKKQLLEVAPSRSLQKKLRLLDHLEIIGTEAYARAKITNI